jgi:hypothetical protein
MFVYSHVNVLLPDLSGSRRFMVQRDYIGEIPDWAAETDYFAELVKDGKISLPESRSDKAIADAEAAPRRKKKGDSDAGAV